MNNPFWKVYKIKLINKENTLVHYSFYRGFTWEAVNYAIKLAEEKGEGWGCSDITRIY